MANELTISVLFQFLKGATDREWKRLDDQFDVTGTKCIFNVQTVGTSEEALQTLDAGVGGYIMARNNDTTNFVSIHADAGETDLVRLAPGDICVFRVDGRATPFVIADTASCELEYLLVEA